MSIFSPAGTPTAAAGQAVGTAIGSALPVPYLGSFLGGTVGKVLGGLFGGDEKRINYGVGLVQKDGLYVPYLNPKDKEIEQSRAWSTAIAGVVNTYKTDYGIELNKPQGWYETNQKDKGTFYRQGKTKIKISSTQGDSVAVLEDIFKRTGLNEKIAAENTRRAAINATQIPTLGAITGQTSSAPPASTPTTPTQGSATPTTSAPVIQVESPPASATMVTTQSIDDPAARIQSAGASKTILFTGGLLLAIILLTKGK